jgi:hypothetical protein
MRMRTRIAIATAAVALVLSPTTASAAPAAENGKMVPAPAGTQALSKKHVKSNVADVYVYTSSTGNVIWDTWGGCTNFYTDGINSGRYHTWWNGANAWVTSNSTWVASGWC